MINSNDILIQKVVVGVGDTYGRAQGSQRVNSVRFTGNLPAGTDVSGFKRNPIVLYGGKPCGIIENFNAVVTRGGDIVWFGDFKVAPVGEGTTVAELMKLGVSVLEPVVGPEGLRNMRVVSVSMNSGNRRVPQQSAMAKALAHSMEILKS